MLYHNWVIRMHSEGERYRDNKIGVRVYGNSQIWWR
jgi:hypothetical protein